MFQKLLASMGIGSARVDARLFNASVIPGELLEGEVYIMGGDVAQDIDDIYLKLATQYKREVNDSTIQEECVMANYRLLDRFAIQPREEKIVPFALELPYEIPLTLGSTPVYIRTGLEIKVALNPKDWDSLEVRPHPLQNRVLQAIENLGFHLHKVDCEYNHYFHTPYPFVQEFEFRPTGRYRSYLDELEAIFFLSPDRLEILLEIDKRARGFGGFFQEAFDLDERYARFDVTSFDLDRGRDVEARIDEAIQRHLS
jgi:sporulation-control protein